MGVSRSVHGTFQRARHGILEVKLGHALNHLAEVCCGII